MELYGAISSDEQIGQHAAALVFQTPRFITNPSIWPPEGFRIDFCISNVL